MASTVHIVIDDVTEARIALAAKALNLSKEQLVAAGLESILRVAERRCEPANPGQEVRQGPFDS